MKNSPNASTNKWWHLSFNALVILVAIPLTAIVSWNTYYEYQKSERFRVHCEQTLQGIWRQSKGGMICLKKESVLDYTRN